MPRLQPTWLLFISVVAHGAAFPRPALAALDPTVRISQYAHTAWRVRDGLIGSAPYSIGQTTDGYLWIGTEAGLVRFDGVRFVPWTAPPGSPLPSSAVYSVLGARDGSLWIGTNSGVAQWTNGRLELFPKTHGRINGMLEDGDGAIWAVRSRIGTSVPGERGPVCRFQEGSFRCFGAAEGCDTAGSLAQDTSGVIWFGGASGLCRWKSEEVAIYLKQELARTRGGAGIGALAARRGGGLWVGIQVAGADLGLRQFTDGSSARYAVPGMDGGALQVSALLVDGNDSLWIGTHDQGLYRVAGGRPEHFASADGLSSDTIIQLFQDREGSLWVVTSKGIDRLRDYRVLTFSSREGLKGDDIGSVLATAGGTVWSGNLGALELVRDGTLSSITPRQGLPGSNVTSLLEDHRGRLWVGVDDSLFVYEGGRFRLVRTRRGERFGVVVDIAEDTKHEIWALVVGERRGLVHVRDLEEREFLSESAVPAAKALAPDPIDGVWLGLLDGTVGRYREGRFEAAKPAPGAKRSGISDVLVDPDGAIWSVGPGGLTRWQDGVPRDLTDREGLPCNRVSSLIRDDQRALWLYTGCGLARIAAEDLDRWAAGSSASVAVKTFDVLDGAQPGVASFRPAASRSPDGRLWFANDHFLQSVDPARLALDERPPSVHVEQLVADLKAYDARPDLRLPPLTREIQVDYTATSFVIPERVRFRYRLEPRDTEWQNPGTRRQAFYNDLPPGAYRFRVVASNHDGVWNETGASLDFTVAPAYYQTAWFRSLVVAGAMGILWMLYLLRLRHLTVAAEGRMETRLAERERIAREIHDTLLQGLNGLILKFQSIADRLSPAEPARAMIDQALDRADRAVIEGRNLVEELRTHDKDGVEIANALREVGAELAKDGSALFQAIVGGRPRPLHVVVGEEVYWVGREALINAFHAARGKQIVLELSYARKELRLRVRDDGAGIDPAVLESGGRPGHWGIRGMRERAARIGARLEISSRVGAGTEVDLRVAGHVAYRRGEAASRWKRLGRPFGGLRRSPE